MTDNDTAPVMRLRATGLEWRVVEGEIVALDLDSLMYLHVNRSGAPLWEMLAGGATRATLTRYLRETHGLVDDEASADLERFLQALAANNVLEA